MDEATLSSRPWSWWWILASSVIVGVATVAAQWAGGVTVLVFKALTTPGSDAGTLDADFASNGVVLSAAMFASAVVCIPVLRWLTGRRESAPWVFLGFRPAPWRDTVLASVAMAICIAIIDPLEVWLGRPLVPPFIQQAYATAGIPALLFLAVAIVAPATEELTFRGFLFGALRARGVPIGVTVGVTSVLFALIHTQYDAWDMSTVLLMGAFFGAARARFNSVIPSMVMHAFTNTVAFIETMIVART